MFYIQQDNKIVLSDEDKQRLQNTIAFTMPKYQGLEIKEVQEEYVIYNSELMTVEEKEAKEAQKERERLNMLFLTGADVERGIYQAKGMDFDDIMSFVMANPPQGLDVKALKIELKANNFYRGNPYVNAVGALLGFTEEQLDKFFETKDYHYLTTCKLIINPTPENATVTIIPEIIPYNTTAHYKVECEGYITKEGDIEMVKDVVLDVVLDESTTDTEQPTGVLNEAETKTTDKPNIN